MDTQQMRRDEIIKFMRWKADIVCSPAKVSKDLYFTKEDEDDIRELNDGEVKMILVNLEEALDNYSYKNGFNAGDLCPFCILFINLDEDCTSCSYGDRHGICNRGAGNDYQTIDEAFRTEVGGLWFVNFDKEIEKYLRDLFHDLTNAGAWG